MPSSSPGECWTFLTDGRVLITREPVPIREVERVLGRPVREQSLRGHISRRMWRAHQRGRLRVVTGVAVEAGHLVPSKPRYTPGERP